MIGLVINLDRAPERWATLRRIAGERGLPVERLPAVDGRAPGALASAAVAPDARLLPGEIACFESHRRAWERVAADEAPFGLVFEDDVYLGEGIVALLARIREAAGGLDLVKLNAHPRGMIVRSQPLATAGDRGIFEPLQTTGDSSAYLIARSFAVRALDLHRSYDRPLDVALFDPETGARVGQLDPAITIQQRYAAFRFLDEGARKSDIQKAPGTRTPRPGPLGALGREAARFWRRRVIPASQPALNLLRAPGARRDFRRIAFHD